MLQPLFIFLRKYWFTRGSSEVVKGVISSGDTGHDRVVSRRAAGVGSSVCTGKWFESKKNVIIYCWKWSRKQAKWLKTEPNNAFAAYIRWSVQRPQACSPYLKNPTHITLLRESNISTVSIFHTLTTSLPNRWNPEAALCHLSLSAKPCFDLFIFFPPTHKCDTPVSCLKALGFFFFVGVEKTDGAELILSIHPNKWWELQHMSSCVHMLALLTADHIRKIIWAWFWCH